MAVGAGLVAELCYVHLEGFNRNGVNIKTLVDHFAGKIMIVCLRFFLNHNVSFGSFRYFVPWRFFFPSVFLEGSVLFQRVLHLDRMDELYAGRH